MTTIDPREYLTSGQNSDASKIDSTVLMTAEYSHESNFSTVSKSEHDAISAAETSTKSPTDFTSVLGNTSSYNAVTSGTDGLSKGVVTTSVISSASDRETSTITTTFAASSDQETLGMNATAVADNSTQVITGTIPTMDITSTPTADAADGITTNFVTVRSTPVGSTSEELTTNVLLTTRGPTTIESITPTDDAADITTQATAIADATVGSVTTKSAITSGHVATSALPGNPTTEMVKSTSEMAKQTTAGWTTQTLEEQTASAFQKTSPSSGDHYETTNAQTIVATSSRILGLEPLHFYLIVAGVAVFVILVIIIMVCISRKQKKKKAKMKANETSAAWISRSNAGVVLGNISYRTPDDDEDPEQPASLRLSGLINAPTVNIFANQNDAFEEERTSAVTAVSRPKSSASPKISDDKTPERKPKGLTAVSVPIITPKKEESADESSEDEPGSSTSFDSNDSEDDKRQKSFLYQPMSGGSSVPSTAESNTTDSVDPPSTTTEQARDADTTGSSKDSSNGRVLSPARPAPPPPVSSKIPVAPAPPPPPPAH